MMRCGLGVVALLLAAAPLGAQGEPSPLKGPIDPTAENGEVADAGLLGLKANVRVVDVPLPDALAALRDQSGVPLAFSPTRTQGGGLVTCFCKEVTVATALRVMLVGTNFHFVEIGGRIIIERRPERRSPASGSSLQPVGLEEWRPELLRRSSIFSESRARSGPRQGTVEGRVRDERTGRPVGGVQVQVVGTGIGSFTDVEGRFSFSDVPAGEVEVRAHRIGYSPESVYVTVVSGESVEVHLAMRQEALGLDELVVTGTPGGTQRRAIGNVVSSISVAEVIEDRVTNNLQTFLPAEVPGLSVRSSGGQIGVGGALKIRGAGSMALGNQPLIFVDGVRVDNRINVEAANFQASRGNPSRLNDLQLSEIESIEVIKGPAAATLYGTEASNGVIQIITKRGREGSPQFEVALRGGTNRLWNADNKYPVVWGQDPDTGELVSANLVRSERDRGTPIFTTGYTRSLFASVSGGTSSLRYYLSADVGTDEGIVSYQWQNRIAARANLSYASESFEVGVNAGMVRQTTGNAAAEQAVTFQVMWGSPLALETRTRGLLLNAHEDYYLLSGEEDVDRVTGGIFVRHQPFEWFYHRLNLGGDLGNARSWALWPRSAEQPGPFWRSIGQKDVIHDRTIHATVDWVGVVPIDLSPRFTLENSAGIQFYRKHTQLTRASGTEFPVPGVSTVSAAVHRLADEDFLENKTLGVFFQQVLGWNDRVFLTGAIRGDDNSAFGEDFDFVTYPKLSATWVLSDEPFWQLDRVNTLRVRAAWGRSGQQPDVFAAARLYRPTTGPGGTPSLTPSNVGNPDLEPEVGEEFELGFDAGLLDDRVALEFTYYWQTRRNAIAPTAALPSHGFPGTRFVNLGEVSNRGMELGVGLQVVRQRDWGWDVGFNVATYRNRIEDLGGMIPPVVGVPFAGQRHMEGYPIGSIFLQRVVHAEFGPDGEVTNVLCEGGHPIAGGGDPVPCEEAGTAFWGQPTPTWDIGASTTVRWRDVRVTATADGTGGYHKCNGDIAWAHVHLRNTRAILEGTDPKLAAYDQLGGVCQAGLVNGGFVRLRDVSLRYQLPDRILGRIGASSASITLSAHNLAVLWQAQRTRFGQRVIDPEVHSNADIAGVGDLSAYVQDQWPMTQRVNLTLRATF